MTRCWMGFELEDGRREKGARWVRGSLGGRGLRRGCLVAVFAVGGREGMLGASLESGAEPPWAERRGLVSYALLRTGLGKMARLSMVNRGSGLDAIAGSTVYTCLLFIWKVNGRCLRIKAKGNKSRNTTRGMQGNA